MIDLVRSRNIALLLSGRLISSTGDWLYTVGLSVAVYSYSGRNAGAVSWLWLSSFAPSLVLSPFAGAFADHLGYRRAMVTADVGRLLLVCFLALTLTPSTWVLIMPVVTAGGTLGTLFRPASVGIIPSLLSDEGQLIQANSALTQAEAVAGVVGSGLGGVAAGGGRITLILLIQAVTYAVSAISLMLIRPSPPGREQASEAPVRVASGPLTGIGLVRDSPELVFAATVMAVPEFASGAYLVWIVPYVGRVLHAGSWGAGYLYAALGIGSILGGFVVSRVRSDTRLEGPLAAGVSVSGVSLLALGLWPIAAAALLWTIVFGAAQTVEYVAEETMIQQAVPETMIGRATGTLEGFLFIMFVMGTAAGGLLSTWIGLRFSIAAVGALVLLLTPIAWWYLRSRGAPAWRRVASLAAAPVFASIPVPLQRSVARRMTRETFPAGAVVVRQGGPGDALYLIDSGTARVEVAPADGVQTHDLAPGDVFGEIALLKGIPRTATVRALEPLTVYVLKVADVQDIRRRCTSFDQSLLQLVASRLQQNAGASLAPTRSL